MIKEKQSTLCDTCEEHICNPCALRDSLGDSNDSLEAELPALRARVAKLEKVWDVMYVKVSKYLDANSFSPDARRIADGILAILDVLEDE